MIHISYILMFFQRWCLSACWFLGTELKEYYHYHHYITIILYFVWSIKERLALFYSLHLHSHEYLYGSATTRGEVSSSCGIFEFFPGLFVFPVGLFLAPTGRLDPLTSFFELLPVLNSGLLLELLIADGILKLWLDCSISPPGMFELPEDGRGRRRFGRGCLFFCGNCPI